MIYLVDDLNKVWDRQKRFSKNFFDTTRMSQKEREFFLKDLILHLQSETVELLDTVKWKSHRNETKNFDRRKLVEELVDVFKYWLDIAVLYDVSPEEFLNAFDSKSSVVEQRYKQEFENSSIKCADVAVIDLDGVIADYPRFFYEFVEGETKKKFTDEEKESINTINICMQHGLNPKQVVELKRKYRTCGVKAKIPMLDLTTNEALTRLKSHGWHIVILSSRPNDKYPEIYSDTLKFLNAHHIAFDTLLFDSDKSTKIVTDIPNVKLVVDDSPTYVKALKQVLPDAKVFLYRRTHNKDSKLDSVKNLNEAVKRSF